MLIVVENGLFDIDNFSKNYSNFIWILNISFGLLIFSLQSLKFSKILF